MKIKDLPITELPRERLLKYGAKNMSNQDLISIILRTGSKDNNVKEISNQVLSKINNINDLDDLSVLELTEIKGLGKVKAITLLAAIELGKRVANKVLTENIILNNTELVHSYFGNLIGFSKQEELLVILLDNKKRLISYKIMFMGTIDASIAHPREIFNYGIKERASGIIVMHNHPSGAIIPSSEDKKLTNSLIETGKIIGIPLIDHLITNGINYYSFFDEMVKHEI